MITMKRIFRILRIWYKGKLTYAKRMRRSRRSGFSYSFHELSTINRQMNFAELASDNQHPLSNFAMMIPTKAFPFEDFCEKENPNGVPIYAGCSAGLCACTGACKRIVGYDTNPEKILAYREGIEYRNKLLKERMSSAFTHKWEIK